MPDPSRCRPRRPGRNRPPRVALYATMTGLGLALGSALVVAALPRRQVVAQAAPAVTPQASPVTPPPSPPTSSPSPIATRPPGVPPAAFRDARPPLSPATPPAIPPAAKEAAEEVARPRPIRELVVKRMRDLSADQFLRQVAKTRKAQLDKTTERSESAQMVKAAQARPAGDTSLAILGRRTDLAGLPLRRGSACRTAPDAARELVVAASVLKFTGYHELERTLANDERWTRPERVPALMQVLTAGDGRRRRLLARQLGRIGGPAASAGLARIALFDPEPEIRREAVSRLGPRPADEYRRALLRGIEYPWPLAAEHAAEALAALRRTETVPSLLALLGGPDPQAPYAKGVGPARFVREVVRINHKINCLMCHPPSLRETDPARAVAPTLEDLSESKGGIGYGGSFRNFGPPDTFVRVDITYLRQDYSVTLTGTEPGPFRGEQRYDLFVRERFATSADFAAAVARKSAGPTGQQKAAAFALRELTGREPGAARANWIRFARNEKRLARQE